MSTVTSFAEAVQFAARCIECPICKEACENPVRPKNCSHRYCMGCFRKCFQDKQEKHCATCRTPILSVSKRGFTEDDLFAKVAALVPGIREAESDDDFDLAKMMERHRQQSEKIRQEAVMMRQNMPFKKPVTHATRQHPEAAAAAPADGAHKVARSQAAPADAGHAAQHAGAAGLAPPDAHVRPQPDLSAGAPLRGEWPGAHSTQAAGAAQHASWDPVADAAAARDSSMKRGLQEMACTALATGQAGALEPDTKRVKGTGPA